MFERQGVRRSSRQARRPQLEKLEDRQLLAASIQPLPSLFQVWQLQGDQIVVDGGAGAPNQTYTVSTDNSNIKATVAQGKFLTIGVSHKSSGTGDISFSGNLVFQLFQDLTPLTVDRISRLVQQGFYNGRTFHRITNMFPGTTDFIAQGGSVNGDGTGNVPEVGFPFQDEFVKQLTFTNPGQLAMANAGRDTNSSQFFVTTGIPYFLDMKHTIFAQLVSGQDILNDLTLVKVAPSTSTSPAPGTPVTPVTITATTLSTLNPDAVIHIDATAAQAGTFTDVTVTATDPVTNTKASQTFQVEVIPPPQVPNPNSTTTPQQTQTLNIPAAVATMNTDPVIGLNQTYTVQIPGFDNEPTDTLTYIAKGGVSTSSTGTAAFTAVQNGTATVSATGLATVTPTAGFVGDIKLVLGVTDQPNNPTDPAQYDYHLVTLHVVNQATSVRLIGDQLVVTPPPRTDGGSNTISIEELGGNITTIVNGVVSLIQPAATAVGGITVFGTKAGDNIQVSTTVDPTIQVTLDGGHGGVNFLKAGDGGTIENGWFGFNTLVGGAGNDTLVGQTGHVRFVKSAGNDVIATGTIPTLTNRSTHHIKVRVHQFKPPQFTFYKFASNGKLVPTTVGAKASKTTTPTSQAQISAAAGPKPRALKPVKKHGTY